MNNLRRSAPRILLASAALFLIILFGLNRVTDYTPQHEILTLDTGWDATVQGKPVQTDSLRNLSRAAGITLKRGDKVSISTALPTIIGEELPAPVLFLDVRYAAIEVFLEDKKLASYDMNAFEKNRFISSQYYYVDLPEDFGGKNVTINYYFSENRANYDIPAPRLGAYEDLLRSFLKTYRYPLYCGIFMLVFGAFFLIVSLFFMQLIPELMGQVVSAVISLAFGLWVLTTFRLSGLFMRNVYGSVVDYIAYFQFVPLFYLLIGKVHESKNRERFNLIAIVSTVISEGLILLHFMNLVHITQLRIVYYGTAVIMFLILLYYDYEDIKNRNMDVMNVLQMTGPTLFCIFGVIAMIIYTTGGFFRNDMPSDLSLFFFTTGCISFVLTRFLIFLFLMTESYGRRLEFDSLTRIANVDMLSGLCNLNYAEDMFGLLDHSKRDYGIASFDLNHLKYVNDTFGHGKGDALIIAFSDILKGAFPETASCCRVGGDEFLVIFDVKSEDQVKGYLKKIEDGLEALNKIEPMIPHSVAAGYAFHHELQGVDASAHAVYMMADRRMYENKAQMRKEESELYVSHSEEIVPIMPIEKEFGMQTARDIDTASRRRLDAMFAAVVAGADEDINIYMTDLRYDYSRWSVKAVDFFGLPGEYMTGARAIWEEHIHPEDRGAFHESMENLLTGTRSSHELQYRVLSKDGKYVVCTCRGVVIKDKDGVPEYYSGALRNYGQQSHIDPVTGLRNQYGFSEDVTDCIQRSEMIRILELGIVQFMQINDIYGYTFGSRVLNRFGRLITQCAGNTAVIYRMDGARFAVLSHDFSEEEMAQVYRLIQLQLKEGFEVDNKRLNIVINGGLLTVDNFKTNVLTVANCLNYAMSESMNRRNGEVFIFHDELTDKNRQMLEKFNVIRNSIVEDFKGFYLCYQLLVNAQTEEVTGAEALLRWKNDFYGNVPPGEFVAILEQDPLFPELGTWILKQAMTDAKKLMQRYPDFVVNVNLSYSQLEKYDFITMVSEAIEEVDFPADHLCLEVTESCRVLDVEMLENIITALKPLGIRFALDDFGTGFSSLSLLRRIDFDVVKIDRQFILDIETSDIPKTTVKAIAELADVYGAAVCVEGVETREAVDILKTYPVKTIQGYYFAKPRPIEELLDQD